MFKIFMLLLIQLNYLLSIETIFIGSDDTYDVLAYSEYSAVKQMNELPNDLEENIWYKNKFDFERDDKHQAYWVKINVKNSENIAKELYLIDEKRYVYSIEYYLLKGNKVSTHKKDGFYVKENVSSFNASQRIFPLSLKAYEEAEILFKVQNYNMLDMPFKIVTKNYLIEYFQLYSFLQGAFFIVLLVMVIYNFITYLIVRVRVYLYYLAYVSLLAIYQAGYFGYLKLLNFDPIVILSFMIMGGVGFIIFAAFFIKELFQLKKYLPKIDKTFSLIVWYLVIIMLVYMIFIVLGNFYASQFMYNMISFVMPVYVFILLYALHYLAYKKVNKVVFIYSIVWSIVSFLGLLLVAMHSNFISTHWGVDYLFEVGMFVETILFSLLLAYRIKEIEKEKQEQQLILVQQNRLASMGEMISTIAHQWRQPLSRINGQVLALDIDYKNKKLNDERMESYLLEIEKTTADMSEIINDFMNYFNSSKKLEEFYLSEVIRESIRIVMTSSLKKVEITSSKNDVLLRGYKSELIQAILIVINNGIDAHSAKDTVKINIKVREDATNKILITIKDNGNGVALDVLPHVFEPYYTTKHKSQGTGLGLYILKMIIENGMGGRASLENDVKGAIFTINIPKNL